MVMINTKLKAATLIETLVSLIITMMAFGIGMVIISNLYNSNTGVIRLKAFVEIQKCLDEAKRHAEFTEKKWEKDEINFIRTAKPYSQSKNLLVLSIEATNSLTDKQVMQIQEIVVAK